MKEERERILEMVRDGKVTVEEGLKLLDALDSGREAPAPAKAKGKFIRVLVVEKGKETVKVNIPVQLARIAARFIPKEKLAGSGIGENIDFDEIIAAVEDGAEGKIVQVEDGDDRIEVAVV